VKEGDVGRKAITGETRKWGTQMDEEEVEHGEIRCGSRGDRKIISGRGREEAKGANVGKIHASGRDNK